jgi:hypothetical protein
MWLPMDHELHFGTNQRAADGKDLVLCVEKRDRNNMFNKRERESERERMMCWESEVFHASLDDYYLVRRLKIFKVVDTITFLFVTLIFHDGKHEYYTILYYTILVYFIV